MKKLPIVLITIIPLVFCKVNNASAQTAATKPSIFENQPNEIEVPISTLFTLLNAVENTPVNISLTNTFYLNGIIISNIQKFANLKTVIVKLLNYPDVTLSISKMSDIHTPEKFVGRIIGLKYNDAYELHFSNNTYIFKKQKMDNLVQPCK